MLKKVNRFRVIAALRENIADVIECRGFAALVFDFAADDERLFKIFARFRQIARKKIRHSEIIQIDGFAAPVFVSRCKFKA